MRLNYSPGSLRAERKEYFKGEAILRDESARDSEVLVSIYFRPEHLSALRVLVSLLEEIEAETNVDAIA